MKLGWNFMWEVRRVNWGSSRYYNPKISQMVTRYAEPCNYQSWGLGIRACWSGR